MVHQRRQNFKVSIPPSTRFVEGRNDYISPNKQPSLENLRPQAIFEAILIPDIDSKNGEMAVMYKLLLASAQCEAASGNAARDYDMIVAKNGRKGRMPPRVQDIILGKH